MSQRRDQKIHKPSPEVEALLDPEFTRADFNLALRKVLDLSLTPEEQAQIRERYQDQRPHRRSRSRIDLP